MRLLPRTFSQVLSDATVHLGHAWRPLASSAMIAFVPAGLLTLWAFRWTGADEFLELVLADPAALRELSNEVVIELARPFLTAALIALAIQGVASVFIALVSHRVVAGEIQGQTVTGADARRFALRRGGTTLIATTIAAVPTAAALIFGFTVWSVPASAGAATAGTSLVAGILLVAFLAPGLWAAASFSMVTAVTGLESAGPIEALGRSTRLVAGRRFATLGFVVLVGLAGFIAIQLIQIVALPLSLVSGAGAGTFLTAFVGIAAQGMIVAAIGVMLTTWYVDLRARKEQLLSENLI